MVRPQSESFDLFRGFAPRLMEIALIAGFLVAISPSVSQSASASGGEPEHPSAQNRSVDNLYRIKPMANQVAQNAYATAKGNGATTEEACRVAGEAVARIAVTSGASPIDAGRLAAGAIRTLAVKPRYVAATAAFAALKSGGGPLEWGLVVGHAAREYAERLIASIEDLSHESAALRAAGSDVPQNLLDQIQEEKARLAILVDDVIATAGATAMRAGLDTAAEGSAIGAALQEIPRVIQKVDAVSYEERIKAYFGRKKKAFSPRKLGLLTGNAMLVYERNWEYVASVAGKSVYEAGGTWADMESVIISLFREYRF